MSISKIRENARAALAGKWGKGACIILAYFAYSFIAGFIIRLFGGEESLLGSILNLIYSIMEVPMLFGITYSFIKLKRNEEVKAFDFFNLGLSNFGRSWKIGLREVLKLILPLIGIIVGVCIMTYSVFASAADAVLGATSQPSTGTVLVGSIIVLASTIWFTVRSLLYSLTVFIAYDNPDMHSLDVVNESARMMAGNRGKIFLLSLSFIGWAILAAIPFGIGYLWLMPYMMVAEVCFYEYLLGKNETNNSEENEEVITEM